MIDYTASYHFEDRVFACFRHFQADDLAHALGQAEDACAGGEAVTAVWRSDILNVELGKAVEVEKISDNEGGSMNDDRTAVLLGLHKNLDGILNEWREELTPEEISTIIELRALLLDRFEDEGVKV